MNRTKWKLTLALLAAVLTAALLTSCFLPGSGVHPAETSIPSEPTAAATEIPQDVTLPPASSADAPTGEPVQDPTAAPTAEPTAEPITTMRAITKFVKLIAAINALMSIRTIDMDRNDI